MYNMYESPPAERIPGNRGEAARLRRAAMRLAAELDAAGLFMPAAYVSMAADGLVLRDAVELRSSSSPTSSAAPEDERLRDGVELRSSSSRTGSAAPQDERFAEAAGRAQDERLRTDVETEFESDEHGRVWMIRDGDCHIIGRTGAVCAEMRRFLAAEVLAGNGDSYE